MVKILPFFFAAFLLIIGQINAQQVRVCAANEVLLRQLQEDPTLQQRREAIKNHTHQFTQSGGVQDRAVVTIPVVVHVVTTTSQVVTDAQIQSQLDVLNADFRKLNSDIGLVPAGFAGLAADAEVNFCLATQTPSGAATTGIERRTTTLVSFGTNDNVKRFANGGLDAWDASKYLNLWVCKLSNNTLGYAQFPGGPLATDGVVITYTGFGTTGSAVTPFNKGRTGTHEVGHWLNLYHIWGDDGTSCSGTDDCLDTPNQADENYGCPASPVESCSNGPNGDMFMNYMDYTDDACMYMFTTGQKARMQSLFTAGGSRNSLTTSPGCNAPSGGSCGTPSSLSASSIAQTSATLSWGAVSGATAYTLQWKISTASTFTTVSGLAASSYNLTGLTANSTYNYQVQATCGGTFGNYSAASSFITLASGGGGCVDQYEPNNSRTGAKVIPVNTTFTAQIATASDLDWYRFSNTSSTKNIKIDLTTLPFDYDLKLYKSSSQLAMSENIGTTSEQIIYNTTSLASSSYYAYVYGYNGAYSSSQCYTLRVSLSSSGWRTDGSTDGEVTELELLVEAADFGMFPNPATSQLTVEVPMEAEADVQVAIFDLSGRAAMRQHRLLGKGDNQMLFDVHSLPNGVYFVQVRNGEQASTRKLVVNR